MKSFFKSLLLAVLLSTTAVGATNVTGRWSGTLEPEGQTDSDRKSTRLNSSHVEISYAGFCLKKKKEVALVGDASDQPRRRTGHDAPATPSCQTKHRKVSLYSLGAGMKTRQSRFYTRAPRPRH